MVDTPLSLRPLVKAMVLTRSAAHLEAERDPQMDEVWMANDLELNSFLQESTPEEIFDAALQLVTLPLSEDEHHESYRAWLRTDGLTLLSEERVREHLIEHLDGEDGKDLVNALEGFLSIDVTDMQQEDLNDARAFSLLMSILVFANCSRMPMEDVRWSLCQKVTERLKEPEVNRVMAYFGEIEETKALYGKFLRTKDWFLY